MRSKTFSLSNPPGKQTAAICVRDVWRLFSATPADDKKDGARHEPVICISSPTVIMEAIRVSRVFKSKNSQRNDFG
jgi:hypothetical protein